MISILSTTRARLRLMMLGLIIFTGLGCEPSSGIAEETAEPFRIVGYLPDYRFSRFEPSQAEMLTDLVLFAAAPTQEGEVELGKLQAAPWERLQQLREEHQTRLIFCVGGWGKSDHFAHVVTEPAARERFVSSTVKLLVDRQLDGLDIDWEYPDSESEWAGYVQLLTQLKAAFRPHGLSLSLTVAPWRPIPAEAWQNVDTVQLMSYDYGQRHSTLEQFEADIQSFLKQGVPARKVVIGIPFYGRDIHDRKAITYSRVVEKFHPDPEVDEVGDYFFNGPKTVRKKTQAALKAEIGGVMIWEVGQDTADETSLLKVISKTVRNWPENEPDNGS